MTSMKSYSKGITKLQTIILLIVVLVACVVGYFVYLQLAPKPIVVKNPGVIVYARPGEPLSFDPAYETWYGVREIVQNVYETLVFYDGSSADKFIPLLAESWYTSPDGLTWVFKIRKGIKFHNGEILTPQDVEYSLERCIIQDRAGARAYLLTYPLTGIPTVRAVNFKDINKVREVGMTIDNAIESNATHVILHLKFPYPPLLSVLCQSWFSVMNKKWCVEKGDWPGFNKSDPTTYETWPQWNNPPRENLPHRFEMCGTGPFMLESYTPATQTVLKRFDDYWRGPAKIERIIIQYVQEWSTMKLMLQTGDADMILASAAHYDELTGMEGVTYYELDTPLIWYIQFNFAISPDSPFIGSGKLDGNGIPPDFFANPDVRKAFAYAINYDRIVKEAFSSKLRPSNHFNLIGLPYYWADAPKYTYDPDKAVYYFKKAYNGTLWNVGFKFTLFYTAGWPEVKITFSEIKKDIEALNPKFQIELREVELAAANQYFLSNQWVIEMDGRKPDMADPHNHAYMFYHSTGTWPQYQHYSNPEVDKLVDEGIKTMDPSKRAEIYKKLCQLVFEDCPSIVVVQVTKRWYQRTWVKGNPYYNPMFVGPFFYGLEKGG